MIPQIITEEYLNDHPEYVFVFGDNTQRQGLGGAAALRNHKQSIGFITKIKPTDEDESFFKPENYVDVYLREISHLRKQIKSNPEKIYLISKLGAGLANRYNIFEKVIESSMKSLLTDFNNVRFLW